MSPLATWLVVIASVGVGILIGCLLIIDFDRVRDRAEAQERRALEQEERDRERDYDRQEILGQLDRADLCPDERAYLNAQLRELARACEQRRAARC